MKTLRMLPLLGLAACGTGEADLAPFGPVAVGAVGEIVVVESDLDCGFSNASFFQCVRESSRIDSVEIEPAGVFEIVSIDGSRARVRALSEGSATARIASTLDGSQQQSVTTIEARTPAEVRPVAYGGFPLRAFVIEPGSTVTLGALVLDASGAELVSDELDPFSDPTGALTIARSRAAYSRYFEVTASATPTDTHLVSSTGHGVDVRIASNVAPTALEMWVPDARGTPLTVRAVGVAGAYTIFFGDLRAHFETLTPEICGPLGADPNVEYTIAASLEVPILAPGLCEIIVRSEGITPALEAVGSGAVAPPIARKADAR